MPTGSLETSRESQLIRVAEERRTAGGLAALVERAAPEGGQVALGDIAEIRERVSTDDDAIWFDGKPAAVSDITKTRAEHSLRAIAALNLFLEIERGEAHPG